MNEKLLSELPSMTHEYEIDVIGEELKIPYKGKFTYKKPNLKAKSLAEKKRAELDGVHVGDLDLTVQKLHFMISYLRYSLTSFPDWWEKSDYGYALYDYNVVQAVFDEADKFETEWTKKVWGEKNVEESTDG
jgi:hypothetical protein